MTRTVSAKAAALAGTAAALSAPAAAQGAIVMSATVGAGLMPPPSDGVNLWDVDGDSTADFGLRNYSTMFANLDDTNGGRLVVPAGAFTDGIAMLSLGETIGPTLDPAYAFHGSAQTFNTITLFGSIGLDASAGGWAVRDTGYFGFKFTSGANTHYGWGRLEITGPPSALGFGQGYKILEAYYNDTPDEPIQAGIPEPSQMALLALGAAGLGAMRRRRAVDGGQ